VAFPDRAGGATIRGISDLKTHIMNKNQYFLACVIGLAASCSAVLAEDAAVIVPVSEDGVQRLAIEMDSYRYTPSHIVVQAGKPVELTLISKSGITPHDFVIDDPAFGQNIDVDVGGGETETATFTPTAAGSFVFYCSKDPPFLASHRKKGMEGRIEVR
jgi:plastocyanin